MKTIYLADRDEAYRKELAQSLQGRGARVLEFTSGWELLLHALEQEPDLIVTETDLDELDGFQVFVWLQRQRPETPCPVVFLTRFDHAGVAVVCKHHGALDYLVKSRPPEDVAEQIATILAERAPRRERELSAALEWLQAQGKSGRLEVTAYGEDGHVILFQGNVLEARWNFFDGEQALRIFREVPLAARFKFVEWSEEMAPPAAGPELPGLLPTEIDALESASRAPETNGDGRAGGEMAAPMEEATAIAPEGAQAPDACPDGGARKDTRGKRALRRVARGALIALPLLVAVAWALTVILPGWRAPGRDEKRTVLDNLQGARQAQEEAATASREVERSSDAVAPELERSLDPLTNQTGTALLERTEGDPGQVPNLDRRLPSPAIERKAQRSARLVQRSLLLQRPTDPTPVGLRPAGGRLLLEIKLGRNGEAQRVEIRRSSGYDAVDRAAVAAARKVRWQPAPHEIGPTGTWITVTVDFDPPRSQPRDAPLDSTSPPPGSAPSQTDRPLAGGSAGWAANPDSRPTRAEPLDVPEASPILVEESLKLLGEGSPPSPRRLLRIRYSRDLAEAGARGSASLAVLVGASGRVEDVRILRSSGHPELDRALVEAVRELSYYPARNREGRAVAVWIEQRVLGVCCRASASSR